MASEVERLKRELEQVKSELATYKNKDEGGRQISQALSTDLQMKLSTDPDYVKQLIRDGTIGINDTDNKDLTILNYAVWYGAIDLAKFLINLGADMNRPSDAILQRAREQNYDHIEQMVLLAQAKSGAADRVKSMSQDILKQNAIVENMVNELALIGYQSQDLFLKILKEAMINILKKKLAFSDDLLSLCWFDETDPLKSELWITIKTVCEEIIRGDSKRDWYWLKQCLLPSNVK